jgi:hypothetical protein
MPSLSPNDLDDAYTHLCHTMTRVGEEQAPLFLARLALLALTRAADADLARQLIDAAAKELAPNDVAASAAAH